MLTAGAVPLGEAVVNDQVTVEEVLPNERRNGVPRICRCVPESRMLYLPANTWT